MVYDLNDQGMIDWQGLRGQDRANPNKNMGIYKNPPQAHNQALTHSVRKEKHARKRMEQDNK